MADDPFPGRSLADVFAPRGGAADKRVRLTLAEARKQVRRVFDEAENLRKIQREMDMREMTC